MGKSTSCYTGTWPLDLEGSTSPGKSTNPLFTTYVFNMEYPPSDWPCLPGEDFELAVTRNPGVLGVEVMAQARVNGRVIDHFRVALGGSEILKVRFSTRDVFLATDTPAIQLRYEVWPRDIVIRRNMSTSEWLDISTLLASRDISVAGEGPADADLPVDNETLLTAMDGQPKAQVSASIRWAVCAGIDGRMELVLQTFPATAAVLSGKPAFRGDNVPVIRLSAWPLQCDIFDGDEAAGPIPTLFSQEPDVTSQNILDNLVKAHNDLQRLAKVFFLMEAVSQDDCPALLKKPR